jgi:hypothetical protein
MVGLVPAIHAVPSLDVGRVKRFLAKQQRMCQAFRAGSAPLRRRLGVDDRDKPGHDDDPILAPMRRSGDAATGEGRPDAVGILLDLGHN